MSAHTPGSWEVDEMLTINAPSTLMVAECSCAANRPMWSGTDYSTRAHQEANARLIAAAPDLLEAAKLVLAWYEAEENHGDTDFYQRLQMCRDSEDAIRTAIAKAEGRS